MTGSVEPDPEVVDGRLDAAAEELASEVHDRVERRNEPGYDLNLGERQAPYSRVHAAENA